MSLRALSEAIILQSADDLFGASHREEGIEFFSGEGFRLCAELAGMTFDEKLKFLHMLLDCISKGKSIRGCSDEIVAGNKKTLKRWTHPHKAGNNALVNTV